MMTTFLISQIYHLKCVSNGTFCELLGMKNSRRGTDTLYEHHTFSSEFSEYFMATPLAILLTLMIIQGSITMKSLTGWKHFFF